MNQKQYLLPDVNMTSIARRRSSLPNPEEVVDVDSIHVKVSPTPSVNGDYQLKPTHKDGYIGTLEEHEALRKNYHSALNPDPRYRITVPQTSAIRSLKPQEINLAVTLVAISLLFICCQSIKIIPDVYEMIYCNHFELASKVTDNELEKICQVPTWIDAIVSVANLSCCINSAGNFILYMLRGKKFRDAFIKTYCRCLPRSLARTNSPTAFSMNTMNDPNTRATCTQTNGNAPSMARTKYSPFRVTQV